MGERGGMARGQTTRFRVEYIYVFLVQFIEAIAAFAQLLIFCFYAAHGSVGVFCRPGFSSYIREDTLENKRHS